MLNCRLKVISPYNHGSSKCKRQIKTISEIIVKHLWDKGQMQPLFATTAAYAMNTFASEALSSSSPFQLIFLRDSPDLTSLSFPKINTVRSNLTIHCLDTPFIIWQPICRPCLLERVYKPIRTPHWCRDLRSLLLRAWRS